MKRRCFFVLGLLFITLQGIRSQTISGTVTDDKGLVMPFATIQVFKTDKGGVSNQDGYYSIETGPGVFQLRYQFVGYRNLDTLVTVTNRDLTIHVRLRPEALTLPTAIIDGSNEDPAYTIMRRTIAKAPYHANQVETYRAMVYIKGSGRLLKTPFLFRNRIKKELAKEGIDSTVAFTQESVSRLSYKRPGEYRDTVISVRSTGDANNTSPMSFVYSSFYDPKVAGAVSPLAPNAFQIYTFEYMGYIEDHGKVINKIKVTPRGRGDQVFEGMLYITDQLWSIHSLDLVTSLWGIRFAIKQVFAPASGDVWMPIDQIYDVTGDVFGFGFAYKYLAHLSNYTITLNPDIQVPLVVLDDKIDKLEAKAANEKINKNPSPLSFSGLEPGQELSAKQLKKMMKEYKKQELESLPEADTVAISFNESKQTVDSQAYKRDSVYWAEIRPVALTLHEIRGYSRMDSLSEVEKQKAAEKQEDSSTLSITMGPDGTRMNVTKTHSAFKLQHLLFGSRYNLNKTHYISILPTIGTFNFNTVDGYHAGFGLETGNIKKKNKRFEWKLRPEIRYAFSREAVNWKLSGLLQKKSGKTGDGPWALKLEGGNAVDSYNPFLPENSYLNGLYTLLFRKNYLKLYEKKYLGLAYEKTFSRSFSLKASAEWADRTILENHTNYSFFNRKRIYLSNQPNTFENSAPLFEAHQALVTDLSVRLVPFQRYVAQGAVKVLDDSKSPVITLGYKRGWEAGDSRFDHFYLGWKHHIGIGAGDDYDYAIQAGTFVGNTTPYFQDFAQFAGNRYVFSPSDPVKYFRLLDYHLYSTNDSYLSLLSNYQFRRFIFTTSPWVRKKGIRENVMINVLKTPGTELYTEFGYSINYILRVLRLEVVTGWQDMKYKETGFRFGVATGFKNLFKF